MKIALVIYQYSDYKGGVERYVSDLTRGLLRLGHEVHIFCHKRDDSAPGGVIFHDVPVTGTLYSAAKWRSFAEESARLLRKESFDIIQGFGRTYYQDILRFGSGCHWEYLRHTHPLMNWAFGRWLHRLNPRDRIIMNLEKQSFIPGNYRKVICISRMVKEEIQQRYRVPEQDITVIPNAVDLTRFTPDNGSRYRPSVRDTLKIAPDDIVILMVGSGFARKGLRYAIQALALLDKLSPHSAGALNSHFKLLIVGKGNVGKYQRLARKWGVGERVIFVGTSAQVGQYYAAADIFLFPSLYDPFGTVVLEAMASGLPALVSQQSGAAEVVTHGTDSYVINPTDAPEIARYLNELSNPAKRSALGQAAVQTARKYPFSANLEAVLKVYEEVGRMKAAAPK